MDLLTPALRDLLRTNAAAHAAARGGAAEPDPAPVAKFFSPVGAATWLATELDEDGDTLFGLADLGFGCPELGSFSLGEIAALLLRGGKTFSGSRSGRGAGVGRMLASRGGDAAFARRRVVIKASIVRLAGRGVSAAAAHLRYLQRDGTSRDGEPGALYGPDGDAADGKAFRERGSGDRHQFRFIVSPEDGAALDELRPLTRRLMERVEQDLGTKLDWVAVDHFNTGHPHTHIVVRGTDDRGADLIIARDYLTRGLRERACELVDLELGPRSLRDVAQALRAEVEQERLTSIDRALLRGIDANRIVTADGPTARDQTVRAGRLAKLARLGLPPRHIPATAPR